MKKIAKNNRNTENTISYCVRAEMWINRNGQTWIEPFTEKWFQQADPAKARASALAFFNKIVDQVKPLSPILKRDECSGDSNAKVERYMYTSNLITQLLFVNEISCEENCICSSDLPSEGFSELCNSGLIKEYEVLTLKGCKIDLGTCVYENSDGERKCYFQLGEKTLP